MPAPFDNPPVAPTSLPSLGTVPWQRLAPRYLGQALVERLLLLGLMAGGLTVGSIVGNMPDRTIMGAAVIIGIVFALMVVTTVLAVPRMGYALRRHDILFRKGLISRSVTAVPLNRIQHVELNRGPLERAFGLASLQVFTAGGSGSDLTVPGLPGDDGERLREFILGRIGEETDD